jgi:hypothetical protein
VFALVTYLIVRAALQIPYHVDDRFGAHDPRNSGARLHRLVVVEAGGVGPRSGRDSPGVALIARGVVSGEGPRS